MTSYALSIPASAIEPFVSIRERVKGSGDQGLVGDRWDGEAIIFQPDRRFQHEAVDPLRIVPASAIEPFVSIRERVKGSGEYPRWLKSFVNSYHRRPVGR
jgi:hypothetical protein